MLHWRPSRGGRRWITELVLFVHVCSDGEALPKGRVARNGGHFGDEEAMRPVRKELIVEDIASRGSGSFGRCWSFN